MKGMASSSPENLHDITEEVHYSQAGLAGREIFTSFGHLGNFPPVVSLTFEGLLEEQKV